MPLQRADTSLRGSFLETSKQHIAGFGSAAISAPIAAALLPLVLDTVAKDFVRSEYLAYLSGIKWGDRRGSNPRPSEPQSADTCFRVLLYVAE
jgi:hypothetical protein